MKKSIPYITSFLMGITPLTSNTGANPDTGNLEKKAIRWSLSETPKPKDNTIGWDAAKENVLRRYVQDIEPPDYKLEKSSCAGYLRRSGRDLFGKNYSWGDAWKLRGRNKFISEVKDTSDVKRLIINEEMLPGMAIGFYNPHSEHNNKVDDQGKKTNYTHVALYVGVDKNLNPEFIHHEGNFKRKSTLKELTQSGFKPVFIFDDQENQNLASNN